MSIGKVYKTAIYLRLSREDSEKDKESNSISNQRSLILDFLKNQDDLEFVAEYVDDGLSGFDFERPEFEKMIKSARAKEIDCIIVKDLSRLGRNFQKTEEFMQRNFPKLGIRFIAILNGFDSIKELTAGERLAIPVTNLFNEYHVMETSKKLRFTFDNLRKSGKFIGNKIEYGYIIKDKQIVVDTDTADIVRKIFELKLSGMSNQSIGDLLNQNGVLSPMEYKISKNIPVHRMDWRKGEKALWSSQIVSRILKNPIYTGTLVQGKTESTNYRDKTRYLKDPSEWIVHENFHEPIISETVFQIVADLLGKDSYCKNKESYLFSGFAYCGNCGEVLYHRVANGGKNTYWQCMNRKCKDKHNINEKNLINAVSETLKMHIKLVLDYTAPVTYDVLVDSIDNDERIKTLNEQIERVNITKSNLLVQFQSGSISQVEYEEMDAFYKDKELKLRFEKEEIVKSKNRLVECIDDITERFKKYSEISELTREIVVIFIEKIIVDSKDSINIHFRYSDLFTRKEKD